MKILIVDDEKPARDRLRDILLSLEAGHTLVEAQNGLEALKVAEREHPDVVLLDIRMPVMDGLESAEHMAALTPVPAVIFTTAYDEHALKAFDANAVDYLLKPVRAERLATSLERAKIIQRAQIAAIQNQDPDHSRRTHLSAVTQGKIQLIPIDEICYFKADQKYVTVCWSGNETLIDDSLVSLEEQFRDTFMRIHRNALVSITHIEALEKTADGSYQIKLKGVEEKLPVSRRHTREVKLSLKNPP